MKVYILTTWSLGYGRSEPIAVFDILKKAEEYIDKHPLVDEDDMYDIYVEEVK
jgi:hypothetical protein